LATPPPFKDFQSRKSNLELTNAAQTIHVPTTKESEETAKPVFKEEAVQDLILGELKDRLELTQTTQVRGFSVASTLTFLFS
jgi:hypothetical protein